jgi:ribonuclease E
MLPRFPFLLRTGKKFLEIAGAGCASAVVAFLLGNSHEQSVPLASSAGAPAVVRLAPADEEMIRAVRQENATLVAHLRTGSPRASAPATTASGIVAPATTPSAATGGTAAAKTVKPAPAQARKEAKVPRPAAEAKAADTKVADTKPRPVEAAAVTAAPAPAAQPARPASTAATETPEPPLTPASAVQAESGQTLGIKPLSSWFADIPRPPVGIGESVTRYSM